MWGLARAMRLLTGSVSDQVARHAHGPRHHLALSGVHRRASMCGIARAARTRDAAASGSVSDQAAQLAHGPRHQLALKQWFTAELRCAAWRARTTRRAG
jgi:hypothetical protein